MASWDNFRRSTRARTAWPAHRPLANFQRAATNGRVDHTRGTTGDGNTAAASATFADDDPVHGSARGHARLRHRHPGAAVLRTGARRDTDRGHVADRVV